jgi:membrane protein YqaA with SNARE-associated domain
VKGESDYGKTGSKLKNLYVSYKKRGFFTYIGRSILLIIFFYSIFVLLVFLTGRYLLDFNRFFESLLDRLSDNFVLILFFVSESFLGLVPVDLFVVWTQKFSSPYLYLSILGVLSFVGAMISYWIGRRIAGMPAVKIYSEKKLSNYMDFARKWGGAFIIIAALFPFTPFSLVVIALALLRFPFRSFLMFALVRLIRFVVQGFLFFDVFQMDKWVV